MQKKLLKPVVYNTQERKLIENMLLCDDSIKIFSYINLYYTESKKSNFEEVKKNTISEIKYIIEELGKRHYYLDLKIKKTEILAMTTCLNYIFVCQEYDSDYYKSSTIYFYTIIH